MRSAEKRGLKLQYDIILPWKDQFPHWGLACSPKWPVMDGFLFLFISCCAWRYRYSWPLYDINCYDPNPYKTRSHRKLFLLLLNSDVWSCSSTKQTIWFWSRREKFSYTNEKKCKEQIPSKLDILDTQKIFQFVFHSLVSWVSPCPL